MSRIFFATELEGVATFWRIFRNDGVTLAFSSHDRDLVFNALRHRAAPGMLPSAIRRDIGLDDDRLEVEGVLSHDGIAESDLRAGRFDGARVAVGLVDWETLEHAVLFTGELSGVSATGVAFEAELRSAKTSFNTDLVPRTSPTCRAYFCDADCQLNAVRFTHVATLSTIDVGDGRLAILECPGGGDAAAWVTSLA